MTVRLAHYEQNAGLGPLRSGYALPARPQTRVLILIDAAFSSCLSRCTRHTKLTELMLRAEDDVLSYKTFPKAHWRQIHSTNPLERLNKEIKRRTNVVGIFPNAPAIRRLVGALMLEQNDEWAVSRRYMTLETVAAICEDITMDPAKIAAL